MNNSRLTAVCIERFKAFRDPARIDLKPLTIIIGRNNVGKSTLIQSLLLLKQTLQNPRSEVMLSLEGFLDAFNLRELTTDSPTAEAEPAWPVFELEWETKVDLRSVFSPVPDLENLVNRSGVKWLRELPSERILKTSIKLYMAELGGATGISRIVLKSHDPEGPCTLDINLEDTPWSCWWNGRAAPAIEIELDHFIPYLHIDQKIVGPRLTERAYYNAYLAVFKQPLQALQELLLNSQYLGSSRVPPPSLYRAAQADPSDIGVSGEFAAQLLQRRKNDIVHFLPLPRLADDGVEISDTIRSMPMVEAVNDIMKSLSIDAPVSVRDIEHIGFQLKFGGISASHVGRGLNHILPVVEVGLFADPLRFSGACGDLPLDEYLASCSTTAHVLLEEPEAHTHPKVASRLAHLFVSLAQSNRRVIVETHSDHMVRRLRGLIARAGANSPLEKWLVENVAILNVEQDDNHHATVSTSRLTPEGNVSDLWPADFMDEATNEESAIYYAQLEKSSPDALADAVELKEGAEPVPDEAP